MTLEVINQIFGNSKNSGKKVFVGYLTISYPSYDDFIKLACNALESGVDILEIGIPFSDPVADGVIIQEASYKAIENGFKIDDCLKAVKFLRDRYPSKAIILMGYYNSFLAIDSFKQKAKSSSLSGVIIVDLPFEENKDLASELKKENIALIQLITSTTGEERQERIIANSQGFIYFVSINGITGTQSIDTNAIKDRVIQIKQAGTTPCVVGFGIKTPEDSKKVNEFADGFVVGSQLIKAIDADNIEDSQGQLKKLVVNFKKTC